MMRTASLFALPWIVLAAAPPSPQAPAIVNVELSNFKFMPNAIALEHGKSYVLRLHNVAGGGHDFTSPAFFAAATIAAEDRAKIVEGEVEVPAGQTREIHLTAPGGAATYKVRCTHSFHKMFGMSGAITVR